MKHPSDQYEIKENITLFIIEICGFHYVEKDKTLAFSRCEWQYWDIARTMAHIIVNEIDCTQIQL